MKITIRRKLFFLVAIIVSTYTLALSFVLVNFRDKLIEDAKQITLSSIHESAESAHGIINSDFEIARSLASTLAGTVDFETLVRETLTEKVLRGSVSRSPKLLSAWLSMELSAIDENWTRPYGRKRYTYYQTGAPVLDTVNTNGDVPNSLYFLLKKSKAEELTEPYLLSSTSSTKDQRNNFMGTSVCVPLLDEGKFIGLAGLDLTLEALDFISRIKPYEGATSFLISNEGVIVSHEKKEQVGKPLASFIQTDTESILTGIKTGKEVSFISSQGFDDETFVAFTPLAVGSSKKPWAIGTLVPMDAITSGINSILIKTILLSLVGLAVLVASVMVISAGITKPIHMMNQKLKELARGEIFVNTTLGRSTDDEIGEMIHSVNFLETNLHEKVNFAMDIGSGKFETNFKKAGDADKLGIALEMMRNNLKQFREDEEKRIWTNDGLAGLNDVLRKQADNSEEFYYQVLKSLLKFLDANQGAIFLVEDDVESGDKVIDLVSAYAYDRKKYITQRLSWGESMVGQCILEGQLMYLKEVPSGYIKITSGLGEATPKVLILVPLKTDSGVVGAIEIASFKEYSSHQLEFIEKAGTIIAASINNYRLATRARTRVENQEYTTVRGGGENKFFE